MDARSRVPAGRGGHRAHRGPRPAAGELYVLVHRAAAGHRHALRVADPPGGRRAGGRGRRPGHRPPADRAAPRVQPRPVPAHHLRGRGGAAHRHRPAGRRARAAGVVPGGRGRAAGQRPRDPPGDPGDGGQPAGLAQRVAPRRDRRHRHRRGPHHDLLRAGLCRAGARAPQRHRVAAPRHRRDRGRLQGVRPRPPPAGAHRAAVRVDAARAGRGRHPRRRPGPPGGGPLAVPGRRRPDRAAACAASAARASTAS